MSSSCEGNDGFILQSLVSLLLLSPVSMSWNQTNDILLPLSPPCRISSVFCVRQLFCFLSFFHFSRKKEKRRRRTAGAYYAKHTADD